MPSREVPPRSRQRVATARRHWWPLSAAARDLPFACIPAGTRNHFALDLGVDRDDVVGALDAFVDGGMGRRLEERLSHAAVTTMSATDS